MTNTTKRKPLHESCVNYGKRFPMYKFEDVVLDNGAVVQKVVQMTSDEIRENAIGCNAYGDAMEARPSMHNDYNDTFQQYDNLHKSIDNISYQPQNETSDE